MTREEAIADIRDNIKPVVGGISLDMAIEALEQQPCEDCISRQAVLDINERHHGQMPNHVNHEIWKEIKALPPVTLKEKTGHWIMPQQDDGMSDPIYYQVRCSECGFNLDPQPWYMELHQYGADKFCPNCGAKMVEPQESEVKNG